jgi:uncharacterized membrane protein YidH (DUF202 family)
MAFGFVIARLGLWLRQSGQAEERWEALWLGAGFIVAGALCNLVASFRFARIRRALVEGRDAVPGGTAVVALALAVTILGGLLIAYVQVFPQ